MNLQTRINAFTKLGSFLSKDIFFENKIQLQAATANNPWFTKENIAKALNAWHMQLNKESLSAWINPYKLEEVSVRKRVLIIMAGNIPLVGFHDFLSVLISGHNVVIKLSSDDNIILHIIIRKLFVIAKDFRNRIEFVGDIKDKSFDAVIATGSDSSAKYFEYYFKHAKKIIRKNRRSIAILDGSETKKQLEGLAVDVFAFFGLGCRNVSKIFIPNEFDLNRLFEVFFKYSYVAEHKKYCNNYDYYKTISLMNNDDLVENGFLLMKEDTSLFSPVSMLYYQYYDDIEYVNRYVEQNNDLLQCIVSEKGVQFGSTQEPSLWDYADGVDSIDFLKQL